MAFYIDTSALVKLINFEAETPAIHEWVAMHSPRLVSSHLIHTELLRAVERTRTATDLNVTDGLAAVDLLPATASIFEAAGRLRPLELRSLDAIHLATALDLADDCEGMLTYDARLAEASRLHGLAVIAPT